MLKQEAIDLFETPAKLARALGISRSAVSQWPEDQPIPRVHELTIRFELLPDLLPDPASQSAASSEL